MQILGINNYYQPKYINAKQRKTSVNNVNFGNSYTLSKKIAAGGVIGNLALLNVGLIIGKPLIMFLGAACNIGGYLLAKFVTEYSITDPKPVIFQTTNSNVSSIQQMCCNIFLENYTKQEAEQIAHKYKSFLTIEDKDEYIDTLFSELKKDYKLENIPVDLDTDFISGEIVGNTQAAAAMMANYASGTYVIQVSKEATKKELLKHLTHELHHIKQDIIAYQASNADERLENDTQYEKAWKSITEGFPISDIAARNLAAIRMSLKEKMFTMLGIKSDSIGKDNPLYEYARKLVDAQSNYPNKSKKDWYDDFSEQAAVRAEKNMKKLINTKINTQYSAPEEKTYKKHKKL